MDKNAEKIQCMFDGISPKYDLLNRVLSFRRDMCWRKKAATVAGIRDSDTILDLACGTGDMMLTIRNINKKCRIIGADFSQKMLLRGAEKVNEPLIAADACALPFCNGVFDKITIVFGFRNITDKPLALREMSRVLKIGGQVSILEFSRPSKLFSKIYWFYFRFILPRVGAIISGHKYAYGYLPESVINFPCETEYRKILTEAGFSDISFTPYDLGICTATMAVKTDNS
ncbi:MAG: bifunctional demethylmenaquinone methyltransferase/2-methoxy-6-polyprenyl-1,4-benzoquinol methylase UbiE [Deferribacteraceae bacterium]|jgi:demethylmenaquinone methyltransferase/2-methoxy-6-polyprenyl-1,4-benzoquinol methylase|nr:bifunctional demethylmenaquinone methyltransferase/2-methoxy-6-polyprenyl-1,4-benzoquinol methylase UbiE [Deferribacteraceae bacterium]